MDATYLLWDVLVEARSKCQVLQFLMYERSQKSYEKRRHSGIAHLELNKWPVRRLECVQETPRIIDLLYAPEGTRDRMRP